MMNYVRVTRSKSKGPRVGREYQAEIPKLMNPCERAWDVLSTPCLLGSPESLASLDLPKKPWPADERENFILGLYIFEKNFNLLNKFVGTKKMGDLVRFYYGEFRGSKEYHLWVECRKSKGRSSRFYGKRLFSRWRGKMILSRLSSHVEEDHRAMLIESSTRFFKRRITFEEYVFELKEIVGIPALAAAIGAGKGTDDLTQSGLKPGKRTETAASVNHASLTPSDIFDTLNRHSKLSESESSELFFKAVWPQLQVQGWHSEKLENHEKFGLKNPTVFLVDGKKKFSGRLMMGKHYFNSITAVLNEVASKPQILEDVTLHTVADTVLVDEPEPEPARVCRDLHSAKTDHLDELEAKEKSIENGTYDSPKQVGEKSSSPSSVTNKPCVALPSKNSTVEMSPVSGDSCRLDLNLPRVPTDAESEESPEKVIDIRLENGTSNGDAEMARVNDVNMYATKQPLDLDLSCVPTDSGTAHKNAENDTLTRQENEKSGAELSLRKSVRSRTTAKRVLEAFETDFNSKKMKKKRE